MQASRDVQLPPIPPAPVPVVVTRGISAPEAVYRAFNEQRKELRSQLDELESKRGNLQNQLNEGGDAKLRAGLEARVTDLDKRIADVDKQLAAADQQVAQAAAVPGAIVEHPPQARPGPPDGVYIVSTIFTVIVFLPLSIAFARRIWRRGSAAVTAFPQELMDRLNRLDQSMDSIAIEVERIGEGQRFVTRVLTDSGRVVGAGAAQPIDLAARGEKVRVSREGEGG